MNRRCRWSVCLVFCGWMVLCGGVAEAADINSLKTATTLTPTDQADLQLAVKQQAERLAGDDAAAQSAAREKLVGDTSSPVGPPTPTYLNAYAKAINDELLPLASHENPRVRLNAAIVAARVAEKSDNTQLRDLTLKLLKDENQAVALWGLKAAKGVLPPSLRNQLMGGKDLIPAIVATAQKHGQGILGGAIVAEAYDALKLDVQDPEKRKRLTDAMLKEVLDDLQNLLAWRITEYQKRLPPEPLSDQGANLFFDRTWNQQTPEQQQRSMQLMSDLLSLAAQRVPGAAGAEQESLIKLIRFTASTMMLASKDQNVLDVLGPISNIDPGKPPAPAQIQQLVQGVHPALTAVEVFKALTPPPNIGSTSTTPTTTRGTQ